MFHRIFACVICLLVGILVPNIAFAQTVNTANLNPISVTDNGFIQTDYYKPFQVTGGGQITVSAYFPGNYNTMSFQVYVVSTKSGLSQQVGPNYSPQGYSYGVWQTYVIPLSGLDPSVQWDEVQLNYYFQSKSSMLSTSIQNVYTAPSASMSVKTNMQLGVSSGTLSLLTPSVTQSFPAVQIGDRAVTVDALLSNLGVVDATGSFNGWHVTASASTFTEQAPTSGFASGTVAESLPKDSLLLVTSNGTVTASSGSTPVSANGPTIENSSVPIDDTQPVTLLDTKSGYGAGTYTMAFPQNPLQLTLIPATTKIDSINYPNGSTPYTTVITFTLISSP